MDRTKISYLQRHLLTVLLPIFLVCASILFIGRSESARGIASEFMARNAFYMPVDDASGIKLSADFLLREAFFGHSLSETDEKVLILPNVTYPRTEVEYPTSPEASLNEESIASPLPKSLYPIITTDLSYEDIFSINNTTKKAPNTSKLLDSIYDFGYTEGTDLPLVLILHTHATECYSREGSTYYEENAATHTTDTRANMISVGKVLAETLIKNDIPTLHCTVMHDEMSYSDSYYKSAETVQKYLSEYPSIKYVFDVHRDAVMYENGAKARPVTEIDGREAAQIMLLSGTDAGGADFPHWQTNLSFALKLADKISGEYPDLLRPIALRGASYNQQYTDGSLLIEIGTDGNTLSQAKYSAEMLGNSLAKLIKGE